MLAAAVALLCSGYTPPSLVQSWREAVFSGYTPPPLQRRREAVFGFAAAATTALQSQPAQARTPLPPKPRADVDFANFRIGSKVKELATGRTSEQRAEAKLQTSAAIQSDVCAALREALQKRDASSLSAVYTPGAILCDGSVAGPPRIVRGADAVGAYLASQPPLEDPKLTVLSTVPEGEWDLTPFIHVEYRRGSSRGAWLLMRTASGWRIDEDVFPLEAPKAIALMQPRRNEFGERYLEFESGRASYR